jgi:predicted alpha/beta superfamily hydrolase
VKDGLVRLAFAAGLLALLALAAYAAWRLARWREAEREAALRERHTLTGRVERHPEFRSEALGGTRPVWVYLPPRYEIDPGRRYPVLYLHDGQNVFDGATAFIAGEEWEVDEAAERLVTAQEIEPLIVVAVDNGGERRIAEYTPTWPTGAPAGGGADVYGRMLIEELKPWIDRTYRTRPGRESTAIGGSSLGGLVSLYLGLVHPEVFSGIAALSPSVWWDDEWILRFVGELRARPEIRVWVDVGTREGDKAVPRTRRLRDALVAKGWRDGVDLGYVEAAGARHEERAWAARMPDVLRFLFPARSDTSAFASGPREALRGVDPRRTAL